MNEISDELRKWCDSADVDGDACGELRDLADRIDSEMVELPKDRDGVPIHVGDPVFVFRIGDALFVSGILMKAGRVCVRVNHAGKADNWYTTPDAITHNRPDSWERIAYDIETVVPIDDEDDERFRRELADRIRRLAKDEKAQ